MPGGVREDLFNPAYHGLRLAWVSNPSKNPMASKTTIQIINETHAFLFKFSLSLRGKQKIARNGGLLQLCMVYVANWVLNKGLEKK